MRKGIILYLCISKLYNIAVNVLSIIIELTSMIISGVVFLKLYSKEHILCWKVSTVPQ